MVVDYRSLTLPQISDRAICCEMHKNHECSMIEATEVFLQTAGSVGYPYRYILLDAIFLGLGDVELKSHTVYYEIARTRRLIVHSK